jgi:GNAT superfamily N-acetyltransferase
MAESEQESGYIFDTSPSDERERFVTEQLREFNEQRRRDAGEVADGPCVVAPVHVYALNWEGAVIGGLIGWTHRISAWLEVSVIWVEEGARGQGVGRRLMERAEALAREQGCVFARLTTSDYQAPDFYEKLGYSLYGSLEDCPPGETVYYYRKDLDPSAPIPRKRSRVAALVRERLRQHRLGDVTLDVIEEEIYEWERCWRVPVRPSAEPPRTYEYYEVLAEVEAALEEEDKLQIHLVSSEPLEEMAAPVQDTTA